MLVHRCQSRHVQPPQGSATVVDTLEAIKLFLAVPRMAFVVAADEPPVAHAIATRFGVSADGTSLATKYLEKIVQIPVRVPALGQADGVRSEDEVAPRRSAGLSGC